MKRNILYLTLPILVFVSCQKETADNSSIEEMQEGLAFSISSSGSLEVQTKSNNLKACEEYEIGGLTIDCTESLTSDYTSNTTATKGAPVESIETFRDSIQYFKVWGWNNSKKISLLSSPQTLKKKGRYYYPVDASDNFQTIIISNMDWSTPKFYAVAPATPVGTWTLGTASNTEFSFTYTLPAPNTAVNCDAQAQRDFLTGVFTGDESNLANNVVPLTFDHPLAAVRFKLGTVAENFTINSISLKNVWSKGTCKVNVSTGAITWSSQTTAKTYVQNFDQSFTTTSPEGTVINDDGLTMTFFAIPATYANSSSACIEINYTMDGEELVGSLPLREHTFEANKTYTFTVSALPGPWFDFANVINYGGNSVKDIEYIADDHVKFNYPQVGGDYEKFIIPIKQLKVGRWYKLDFTELLTTNSSYWNGASGPGIYACKFSSKYPTSTARSSMITYYSTDNDSETYDKYVWMGYEGYSGYKDKWVEHNIMTFKATARTMYWIWDTSKCSDDATQMKFEFTKNDISRIIVPTVPAVDYLNSEHYGFYHIHHDDVSDGFSTFKTSASYGTSTDDGDLEFHAYPRSGKHEKFNIPLVNLTVGNRYRITAKYTFNKVAKNSTSTCYFGFSIRPTKNTNVSSATDHSSDDFQNLLSKMTVNTTYDISYEFEATQETMYWVWDMSRLQDTNRQILKFTETRIEVVN